jgi:cytochrome c-type biogenesis protein
MAWIEVLLEQATAVTPTALAIVALAGLVVGIAPSSLPLLSVAAGFGAGQSPAEASRLRLDGLWLSVGFALGITTVDALIGASFGLIGFGAMRLLMQYLAPTYLLLALLLLVLGLALFHVIRIPFPMLTPTPRPAKSVVGAYLLGLPFGLSTCPACTPLLFPIVTTAAATGDPVTGAVLVGTFGVFRSVPIVAVATAAGLLKHSWRTWKFVQWFERISGALLIAAAFYFLVQALVYAGWLPPSWALSA